METEEVLKFLQRIADQLGPTGQEAFRVVASRIYAESIVWIIVGFVFILTSLFISLGCIYGFRHSSSYDKGGWALCIFVSPIIGIVFGLMVIVPKAFNLYSIEYATIERILNLVGRAN
jgi:hypothetical protein